LAAKDKKAVSEEIVKRTKDRPSFPQEHAKDCKRACEELVTASKEASRLAESESSLKEAFFLYQNAFVRFAKFMAIPVAVERTMTARITAVLGERVQSDQVQPTLGKLMTTPTLSELQLEQLSLLRLAIRGVREGTEAISEDVEKHSSEYRWLSCYNLDEMPLFSDHFLGRLQELMKLSVEVLQSQLHELEEGYKKDQTVFQETLDELGLDEVVKKEIEVLRGYVYLRTYRIEMQSKSHYFVHTLFQRLASHLGLSLRHVVALTPSEIESALDGSENMPHSEELETRVRHYGFRYDDTGTYFVAGPADVESLKMVELGKDNSDEVKELKGTIAYKAEPIQGLVRVIINKEDMQQFKEGEILVTTMTTPEFVPIMKKAKAIVTNEGGVLCHAAIVAREMKIPCVIGTQQATTVFKNGEKIEVDASEGMVRKV
jgi:phosphoenolpyruvate synthase/pyruvate phosphate dikinase